MKFLINFLIFLFYKKQFIVIVFCKNLDAAQNCENDRKFIKISFETQKNGRSLFSIAVWPKRNIKKPTNIEIYDVCLSQKVLIKFRVTPALTQIFLIWSVRNWVLVSKNAEQAVFLHKIYLTI